MVKLPYNIIMSKINSNKFLSRIKVRLKGNQSVLLTKMDNLEEMRND